MYLSAERVPAYSVMQNLAIIVLFLLMNTFILKLVHTMKCFIADIYGNNALIMCSVLDFFRVYF